MDVQNRQMVIFTSISYNNTPVNYSIIIFYCNAIYKEMYEHGYECYYFVDPYFPPTDLIINILLVNIYLY